MTFEAMKFKVLAQLSADQASVSLAKLTKSKCTLTILNVDIRDVSYDFKTLSDDSYVTAISLPIRGDLSGSTLLLFPKETAKKMASLLVDNEDVSKSGFNEMEVSSLKEVGNIICGTFLTVLANSLGLHIYEHVPLFVFDTLSSVLLQLELASNKSEAVFIEVHFNVEGIDISGYVVLVLGINQMREIRAALNQFDENKKV